MRQVRERCANARGRAKTTRRSRTPWSETQEQAQRARDVTMEEGSRMRTRRQKLPKKKKKEQRETITKNDEGKGKPTQGLRTDPRRSKGEKEHSRDKQTLYHVKTVQGYRRNTVPHIQTKTKLWT